MKSPVKLLSFCVLLFGCGLCKDFKCTLEAFIKKSVQHEIKFPSLLKRQLSNEMDDDPSEVYGGIDKESAEKATEETTSSSPFLRKVTRRKIPLSSTTKSLKSDDGDGCKCRPQDVVHEAAIFREHTTELSKAQSDEHSREASEGSTTNNKSEEESITFPPTLTTNSTTRFENGLNETHIEANETEFQTIFDISNVCPYFKEVPQLELDKMADVWQLVYYKSQEKLSCFRIYINKTTPESRKHYGQKFSTFNETINWKECHLEITSEGNPKEEKNHFLQGNKNNRGILENIVVSQENENGTKIITLLEQAPDQWLVTKDFLLMRDCENGDVVLFARVPNVPNIMEVEEALVNFGEDGMDGVISCIREKNEEKVEDTHLKRRYDILS